MDQVILMMLEPYACKTLDDYENALKQIIQQIALLGLWRSKFFEHAAFYGGTALRMLYQLDRFSEDLDFSLLKPDKHFNLTPYLKSIVTELMAYGFEVTLHSKEKTIDSSIKSAFLKANTQINLIKIIAPIQVKQHYHSQAALKVKIEVDIEPPLKFETEAKPLLQPIPFSVNTYTLPNLFAGKISALLCRQWKTRVKGRDWYDFIWFIQKKVPPNLIHLEQRLRYFDFYKESAPLTLDKLKTLLNERIKNLNVELAKNDVMKFIKNPSRLEGWSREVFQTAVEQLHTS